MREALATREIDGAMFAWSQFAGGAGGGAGTIAATEFPADETPTQYLCNPVTCFTIYIFRDDVPIAHAQWDGLFLELSARTVHYFCLVVGLAHGIAHTSDRSDRLRSINISSII